MMYVSIIERFNYVHVKIKCPQKTETLKQFPRCHVYKIVFLCSVQRPTFHASKKKKKKEAVNLNSLVESRCQRVCTSREFVKEKSKSNHV